jgi:hypothetical protein
MRNIATPAELLNLEEYFHELFSDELKAPSADEIADATAGAGSHVLAMLGSDDLGVENAQKFTVDELKKLLEIGLGAESHRQMGMLNTEYDADNGYTPWDSGFNDEEYRGKGHIAKLEFQEQQLDGQYALHEMMFSGSPEAGESPDGVLIADGMGVGKTWYELSKPYIGDC